MKRLGMTRREDMDFPSADVPRELNPVIVYRIDADEWPAARAAALARAPRRASIASMRSDWRRSICDTSAPPTGSPQGCRRDAAAASSGSRRDLVDVAQRARVSARAPCAADSACWAAIQLSLCGDPAASQALRGLCRASERRIPAWAWSIKCGSRLVSAGSDRPTVTSLGIGTRGSIASAALGASDG